MAVTVTGTVSGATQSGVTISYTGAKYGNTTTGTGGTYSITCTDNSGTLVITPTKTGYTFSPTSRSNVIRSSNITSQNFTATAATVNVSGQVTEGGVGLSGVTITFSGGSTVTATTDASGNWTATPAQWVQSRVTELDLNCVAQVKNAKAKETVEKVGLYDRLDAKDKADVDVIFAKAQAAKEAEEAAKVEEPVVEDGIL